MGCSWSSFAGNHSAPQPSPANTSRPVPDSGQKKPKKQQTGKSKKEDTTIITNKNKNNKKAKRRQQGSLTPFHDKLPPKAKKCSVRSVYDGDTMSLFNKKRLRFLGIDTPELKNPTQAFSQEAKAYTVQRCANQQIWISCEGPETDRYGRLLAWVWVQTNRGDYENVCEGLVREGLASVYTPSKGTKLHNMDKLIALQKEARESKRGMWHTFRDSVVVRPRYGCAFHHKNGKCEHLKRSKNLIQTNASLAMDEGRHACRTCLADEETTGPSKVSVY